MIVFDLIIHTLFLPLFVIIDIFESKRSIVKKIVYFLIIVILLGFGWFKAYSQSIRQAKSILFELGLADKLERVKVYGTSMMPIINDNSLVTLHNPNKYELGRGDIVSFHNVETGSIHYIKRIIGLPEEKVMLKNGHVFINDRCLKEPYIFNDLPTYGNTFLKDCYPYTIPKGHYFVLGDNRSISQDSRVLGFIDKNDINGVIKANEEYSFASQAEQKNILKTEISSSKLVKKINVLRKNNDIQEIAQNQTLDESAQAKAESIADKFDDWKTLSLPLGEIMASKGYGYNTAHQFITFGYLDEESIVNQIIESPQDKISFLSNDYSEIGIGVKNKQKGECSFPIIVIVLATPVRPDYDQETINFWQQEGQATQVMLNELEQIKNLGHNSQQIDLLIKDLDQAFNIVTNINQKIDQKKWFSQEEVNQYEKITQKITRQLEEIDFEVNIPSN